MALFKKYRLIHEYILRPRSNPLGFGVLALVSFLGTPILMKCQAPHSLAASHAKTQSC